MKKTTKNFINAFFNDPTSPAYNPNLSAEEQLDTITSLFMLIIYMDKSSVLLSTAKTLLEKHGIEHFFDADKFEQYKNLLN